MLLSRYDFKLEMSATWAAPLCVANEDRGLRKVVVADLSAILRCLCHLKQPRRANKVDTRNGEVVSKSRLRV